MLLPGEEIDVVITATIDSETADALNCGREVFTQYMILSLILYQVLDDIMVLRVENGQDFFITVKGTYARSCFGLEPTLFHLEFLRNVFGAISLCT